MVRRLRMTSVLESVQQLPVRRLHVAALHLTLSVTPAALKPCCEKITSRLFAQSVQSISVHICGVCVNAAVCVTPNSSSKSSMLRHLKANPGSSKPIHLQ